MLIRGKRLSSKEMLGVYSPYDNELVGEVAKSGPECVEEVVSVAQEGFAEMREMPTGQRIEILEKTAARMLEYREELAKIITLEVGKTINESRVEVTRAAGTMRLSAAAARELSGSTVPMDLSGKSSRIGFYQRVPVGIVLAITPFNVPLNLVCHKVGPALGAGNSVIIKPASKTPLIAMKLVEILLECGLPENAVTVVCGSGETLGAALVMDKRVRKVSFTGSYDVGENICRMAGLKKVSMELGNNGPVIVTSETNIPLVAEKICRLGYAVAGQVCISVQRVYAHRSIQEHLLEEMKKFSESLIVGNPLDEKTQMGPMITPKALGEAKDKIEAALAGGTRLITGFKSEGNILHPTILADAAENSVVIQEEMFAPVITVNAYDDLDKAIDFVNNTRYGLQSSIFTNNLSDAMKFIKEVDMGGVVINEACACREDVMPYGGIKDSGIGREGPAYAMQEMTEYKMIIIDKNLG